MFELENFYNHGFGWICRRCEAELKAESAANEEKYSRLLKEGEAESKTPTLSNQAMARWMDKTQQVLLCPRCGIAEPVNKF